MWFVPLKDMWGCHFAHRVEVTLYLNENQHSNTLFSIISDVTFAASLKTTWTS